MQPPCSSTIHWMVHCQRGSVYTEMVWGTANYLLLWSTRFHKCWRVSNLLERITSKYSHNFGTYRCNFNNLQVLMVSLKGQILLSFGWKSCLDVIRYACFNVLNWRVAQFCVIRYWLFLCFQATCIHHCCKEKDQYPILRKGKTKLAEPTTRNCCGHRGHKAWMVSIS